jgi:hypothetical protein
MLPRVKLWLAIVSVVTEIGMLAIAMVRLLHGQSSVRSPSVVVGTALGQSF